jgi:biopolymer transport protein ExbD
MRFQRHAKIFRGQLDPAPIAAVFFLLLIFIILGSLLYTPGVLVELKNGEAGTGAVITVKREGNVDFLGKTYRVEDFAQLRADIGNLSSSEALQLKMDPGASAKIGDQIRELLAVEAPSFAEGMVGTDNPVVIVAVNLRGQLFFENRLVQEQELETILKDHIQLAAQDSKNLTLVLLQDNGVSAKTFVRLSSLAKKVGVKEVLLATRPGTFAKGTGSRAP